MIRLVFGNVGSGKTLSIVKEMKDNPQNNYITNIDCFHMKNVRKLKGDMIIKKELLTTKRDGTKTYKYKLNSEFWTELAKEGKNYHIIIDEAHIFFSSRNFMSKISRINLEWLALIRKITGSSDQAGSLTLISQLSRRLDVIAREMSTEIKFCRLHYVKQCVRCKASWNEFNDMHNRQDTCPRCHDYRLNRLNLRIECFHFRNNDQFLQYFNFGIKTYYKRYMISGVKNYFNSYNTLQVEDLFSDY